MNGDGRGFARVDNDRWMRCFRWLLFLPRASLRVVVDGVASEEQRRRHKPTSTESGLRAQGETTMGEDDVGRRINAKLILIGRTPDGRKWTGWGYVRTFVLYELKMCRNFAVILEMIILINRLYGTFVRCVRVLWIFRYHVCTEWDCGLLKYLR
jgi:hypothetical protein